MKQLIDILKELNSASETLAKPLTNICAMKVEEYEKKVNYLYFRFQCESIHKLGDGIGVRREQMELRDLDGQNGKFGKGREPGRAGDPEGWGGSRIAGVHC